MSRRKKTDGERIALRLFVLEIDDMEPSWLATQIDRLIRKRMAEAWGDGWFAAKWDKKHVDQNPYRGRRRKK